MPAALHRVLRGLAVFGILFAVAPAPGAEIVVAVRDSAAGGEDSTGQPINSGLFRIGTGSRLSGTTRDGAFVVLPVGVFDFEADFGAGFDPLTAFCLEPNQGYPPAFRTTEGVPYKMTPIDAAPELTAAERDYLRLLWGNAFGEAQLSRRNAAAFQVIIWELYVDDNAVFDAATLTAGTFRINLDDPYTLDVFNLAAEWIAAITTEWTSTGTVLALTSAESQDILIPEPSTIALMAAPLLVLRFARRRRR